jgi:ribosome maturation protein Sdo1
MEDIKEFKVAIEIWQDGEEQLKENLTALYELLPDRCQIQIREILAPYSDSEFTYCPQKSFLEQLTEMKNAQRKYRSRWVCTNDLSESELFQLLEQAGFEPIRKYIR